MKKLFFIIPLVFLCINKSICVAAESLPIATTSYSDVKFNIIKAEVINTEPKIFGSSETTQLKLNGYLLVILELENIGEKIINYQSTGFSHGPGSVSLDDELGGHYYRIVNTGTSEDQGMVIYPGESGQIKLNFTKPNPSAKHLILSFPKYNIWGRMEIADKGKDNSVVKIDLDAKNVSLAKKEDSKPFEITYDKEYQEDGLVIKVNYVKLSYWTKRKREFFEPSPLISEKEGVKKTPMVSISYKFMNNTKNKKIDMLNHFGFQLTDEFYNKYSPYPKPEDYGEGDTVFKPEYFPAIHPGESFEEILFFEAPIKAAKFLLLNIDASNVGIKKRIIVKIPVQEITK
jgi:hypothetical protein